MTIPKWFIFSCRTLVVAICGSAFVGVIYFGSVVYYETMAYRATKEANANSIIIIERAKAEYQADLIKQGKGNGNIN